MAICTWIRLHSLVLFLAVISQYTAPPTPPKRKLSGPVKKIPSIGPWFASGVKTKGPKNPAQKPTAPVTTAPITVLEISPVGAAPSAFQTYQPIAVAHRREMTLRISRFSTNGTTENGTQ